jgi:proline iminopeptidase
VSTTRIERADGRTMAYRRFGKGPDLVCLAGGPGANASYLEDLARLDRDFTLIIPDARGTGASDPPATPEGYAFDALADDLEALRRRLKLDRFRLLAHSAACTTALVYASRYPERIAALVLVAPSRQLYEEVPDDTPDILRGRSAEPWYREVVAATERLGNAPDPDEIPGLLTALAPANYARWGPREQAHAGTMAPADLLVIRSFWRSDVDGDAVRTGLTLVAAPVLVITGALDSATGVKAGAAWASCFSNGRHVDLPAAAHNPWIDRPEAFNGIVRAFLADQSASDPSSAS